MLRVESEKLAKEYVERGWNKLAEYFMYAPAWWSKIDVNTIDQTSTSKCVVAQMFGNSYDAGMKALGFDLESTNEIERAGRHGYCYPIDNDLNIGYVTEAWKNKIAEADQMFNDSMDVAKPDSVTAYIILVDGDAVLSTRDKEKFNEWVEAYQALGVDYNNVKVMV